MTALIAFTAIGLFVAGACTGIIGVVSVAIHREDKHLTLASAATSHVERAGRRLTGVHVRAPRRRAVADQETAPI
jgi:hypothetical protein